MYSIWPIQLISFCVLLFWFSSATTKAQQPDNWLRSPHLEEKLNAKILEVCQSKTIKHDWDKKIKTPFGKKNHGFWAHETVNPRLLANMTRVELATNKLAIRANIVMHVDAFAHYALWQAGTRLGEGQFSGRVDIAVSAEAHYTEQQGVVVSVSVRPHLADYHGPGGVLGGPARETFKAVCEFALAFGPRFVEPRLKTSLEAMLREHLKK